MNRWPFRSAVLLLLALVSPLACAAPSEPALIPLPAQMQRDEGRFVVSDATPVVAEGEAARQAAKYFVEHANTTQKLALRVSAGPAKRAIVFAIDPKASTNSEGYALQVRADGATVKASDPRGLFYGAVTLWQLLESDGGAVQAPAVRIDDAPRFAWRGLMLDTARHFRSVDEVKRLLDALALHKLNTFHWHLTDDQGWRIEIKKYPKLTGIGGCRFPAGDGGVDPNTGEPRPYCGFYTQDQIRDVVRYAAERHITIVPEIDVPGHAQAAIAAYPELGVLGTRPPVSNEWGVNTYLFNVEESTFRFLEDVLDEVSDLFPGTYIHLGGDEAVKDQWVSSARVQERMRELGVKNEAQMQSYMIARLEKHLEIKRKRLIGWDEILEGGLPPQATVMSWRGTEGGIAAAQQNHDVVMSPVSHLYLDYLQTTSANEPPGRPATISLQKLYDYEPVPAALDAAQKKHILGVQANVWTEHMRSFARVQHAIFPRVAALAEIAWSPAKAKNFDDFRSRLPAQLLRYDALGIAYAKTPFEAEIAADADGGRDAKVSLSNPLGYPIRYTTDGRAPTASSPLYERPFEVPLPSRVRAAAFADGRMLAPASERALDAAALRTRTDEELTMCSNSLMLRLEDDGPADGERVIFNVDIFNPCWRWDGADLDGIAAVRVRAGRIPYFFQLAHDEPHRKFQPARSAHGELVIRAGCDGETLASLPLPAQPEKDGFLTLDAKLPGASGRRDLCFYFTGDTRPTMWAIDRVTLVPR
ncbi:beta-hexosaminidase [Luteimonas gilva]|uniref:beta-N-acetylhexosaminidase n=1 Tax=Luteimonas gilva TaxID=2572684 RepID=A0A4U5JLI3_9GAMM|nr:family 20 glycosylhydrolase [Luteimonas gilva]TKR29371.1 beta-hexosaminidase [Luteimonas gilva]